MNDREMENALAEATKIATEAAALVLEGYRKKKLDIQKKGEIDLVTEYDFRSEELIRKRLEESFPGCSVVGEEGEKRWDGDYVWLVDPIDGTTNYAHGHPYFAVSIALSRGLDPVLGAVVAPVLQTTWTGIRGKGAFRNGERCSVSEHADLRQALCSTGFPYDRHVTEDNNIREWLAFIKRTVGIRRCGAAAIDLAMVADGTYDIFWEQKLQPWDLAASTLFVTEAGGTVCDYSGGPLDMRRGRVLATNGHLHETALTILKKAREDVPGAVD
jgi:myo-inositol-1(or 4)-monophosphatase